MAAGETARGTYFAEQEGLHPLLAEIFGADLPPEPERHPVHVIHMWRP